MFTPGFQELILIMVIVLILFGGKKIPELMGGLGKGIKSFKKGLNEPDEPPAQVEVENTAEAAKTEEVKDEDASESPKP